MRTLSARPVPLLLAGATAIILLLTSAPLGAQASNGDTVPCTDPRGCPDLIVDPATMDPSLHVKNFKPNSCAVNEGMIPAGDRTILLFTYTTPNLGPGDLIVGRPQDHPEWFEMATCHNHFHFREYADYRLWTPSGYESWNVLREANPALTAEQVFAAHPSLLDEFVVGEKRGFCVIDVVLYEPLPPKYILCTFQGISVGWADEYHDDLDGQWIDVTGVPSGEYVLESEVNPERLFDEANYANNRAAVEVTI